MLHLSSNYMMLKGEHVNVALVKHAEVECLNFATKTAKPIWDLNAIKMISTLSKKCTLLACAILPHSKDHAEEPADAHMSPEALKAPHILDSLENYLWHVVLCLLVPQACIQMGPHLLALAELEIETVLQGG